MLFEHRFMPDFLTNMEKIKDKPGALMPILQLAQHYFGCVPISLQKIIAKTLKMSISKVNGVVTFYTMFSIEPKGENLVSVCTGNACYVKGAKEILDAFAHELCIKPGETTKDNRFTLEATRCVGACGMAPVFYMNSDVHGNVALTDGLAIIREAIAKEKETIEDEN